jgi:hypothetical protein
MDQFSGRTKVIMSNAMRINEEGKKLPHSYNEINSWVHTGWSRYNLPEEIQ